MYTLLFWNSHFVVNKEHLGSFGIENEYYKAPYIAD